MNAEFELSRTQLPVALSYRRARQLPDSPALIEGGDCIHHVALLEDAVIHTTGLPRSGTDKVQKNVLRSG